MSRLARYALLGALAGPATRPAAAADQWSQLRSAHFRVLTNGGEWEARKAAYTLEQFREVVAHLLPGQALASPPTEVLLFKNASSFLQVSPRYQGKPSETVAGLFVGGVDRNYIVLRGDVLETAYRSVYHEYLHLLLRNTRGQYPPWFDEGMAEYFSTVRITDKEVSFGVPVEAHVQTLRKGAFIPLVALFEVDHASPYYNEGEKQGLFYAESWAFIHYYMVQQAPQGAGMLERFMRLLAESKPPLEAFRQAFGLEPAVVEDQLMGYMRGSVFSQFRLKLEAGDTPKKFPVAPLSAAEAQYAIGDLLVHGGRFDEGRPHLDQAIQLDANFGPAYRALGQAFAWRKEWLEARRWLDLALARDPSDPFAHYYRALAATQPEGAGSEQRAAALDDAMRAAQADALAEAYDLAGYLALSTHSQLDAVAALLDEGMKRRPDEAALPLRAAELAQARHDGARAKALLRQALAEAPSASFAETCRTRLAQLESPATPGETGALPREQPDRTPVGSVAESRATALPAVATGVIESMACNGASLDFLIQAGTYRIALHAAGPQSFGVEKAGTAVSPKWTCGKLHIPVKVRFQVTGKRADGTVEGRPITFELVSP